MHCTRLAPELSATSSIERGWIMDSGCAARILRIRQRFSFYRGRVSSIRTRSPTRLSLASSCAFSRFDARTTRSYCGWRYTRSIRTTRVFCIASLTTTPCRVLRSPTRLPLPLAEHRVDPREIPPGLAQPRRVLGHAHRELEPQREDLLAEVARLLLELLVGEIAPLARLHRAAIRASGCASRTSSRCPSSARPSGTPRAPRLPARPASRR